MRKAWGFALLFLAFAARAEEAPYTKKVKLGWDEVEKSQAYELEIYKGTALVVKETLIALTWEARLEPGTYKYRVRALDEFSRYGTWTPFEEFIIKPKPIPLELPPVKIIARSSASLGLSYGSFDYSSEISGVGYGRARGANDFSIEGDAQYWFKKYFSVGADVSYTSATLSGVSLNYPELSGVARYSLLRNSSFYIYPLLSVEYMNTPEILSSSATITSLKGNLVNTVGIGAGAEAGWQFSNTWVAGAFLRYIWPMSYSGSSVQSGVADSSTFYKYGLNVNYIFSPKWSTGLEYTYEYRKVSYETSLGRNNLYKDMFRIGVNLKALFGDAQ